MLLKELKLSQARDIKRTNWENSNYKTDTRSVYDKMEYYLEKNRFTLAGKSGSFSSVYVRGNANVVVKLAHKADPCWKHFYEVAKTNTNKHLPKIGQMKEFSDGTFVVFMEKLFPLHKFEDKDILFHIDNFRKYIIDPSSKSKKAEYDKANNWFKTTQPEFFNVLRLLLKNKPQGCGWDLYYNNVMKRKNGTYVVTDPYAK